MPFLGRFKKSRYQTRLLIKSFGKTWQLQKKKKCSRKQRRILLWRTWFRHLSQILSTADHSSGGRGWRWRPLATSWLNPLLFFVSQWTGVHQFYSLQACKINVGVVSWGGGWRRARGTRPQPGLCRPVFWGASLLASWAGSPRDTHLARRKISPQTQAQARSLLTAHLCSLPLVHHEIWGHQLMIFFFQEWKSSRSDSHQEPKAHECQTFPLWDWTL